MKKPVKKIFSKNFLSETSEPNALILIGGLLEHVSMCSAILWNGIDGKIGRRNWKIMKMETEIMKLKNGTMKNSYHSHKILIKFLSFTYHKFSNTDTFPEILRRGCSRRCCRTHRSFTLNYYAENLRVYRNTRGIQTMLPSRFIAS